MEFQKRNLEMSRNVLEGLITRGEIVTEEDALQKLQDRDWLVRQGYGHVAHVLRGPVGIEACHSIFEALRNRQIESGGDTK